MIQLSGSVVDMAQILRMAFFSGLLLSAVPAAAQDEARDVFLQLSSEERRLLQITLADGGLYYSGIDGLWGSGTLAALDAAQAVLAGAGIHYQLSDAEEAADLYSFLLSDAGYGFLAPEGRECDGCDALSERDDYHGHSAPADGVFRQVSAPISGYNVSLTGESRSSERQPMCSAELGTYSDGRTSFELTAWRKYQNWGIEFVGPVHLEPPLIAPIMHQEVLPMDGIVEQEGDEWRTSFINGHPPFMGQYVQEPLLAFGILNGNSILYLEAPQLVDLMPSFEACAVEEERRHRNQYCNETLPEHAKESLPHLREYCEAAWASGY